MRNILFLIIIFAGQLQAQQPKIEDYMALYRPNPDLLLSNFVPSEYSPVSNIQALQVIDDFFLERYGEVAKPGYTGTSTKFYKKGNVVMSCSIFNDSIKWHIQHQLIPQELQVPPGDPFTPVQVQEQEKYWNPYHGFDGTYMVEVYLRDVFGLNDLDGKLWSDMVSETRSTSSLEIAYAYPTSVPMLLYPVIIAFDKDYRNRIEIRLYATNAHREELVNTIRWIAEHMELNDNLPEMPD